MYDVLCSPFEMPRIFVRLTWIDEMIVVDMCMFSYQTMSSCPGFSHCHNPTILSILLRNSLEMGVGAQIDASFGGPGLVQIWMVLW